MKPRSNKNKEEAISQEYILSINPGFGLSSIVYYKATVNY